MNYIKHLINGVIAFSLMISLTNFDTTNSQLLVKENKRLKEELRNLSEQKATQSFLQDHAEVTIANTSNHTLNSKINGQNYQLKVSYPRNYAKSKKQFPVLYVTDAETNFGAVSYIVQRLIKDQLIPEILVVGIAYGTDYKSFYKQRSRDLTPIEMNQPRPKCTGYLWAII